MEAVGKAWMALWMPQMEPSSTKKAAMSSGAPASNDWAVPSVMALASCAEWTLSHLRMEWMMASQPVGLPNPAAWDSDGEEGGRMGRKREKEHRQTLRVYLAKTDTWTESCSESNSPFGFLRG